MVIGDMARRKPCNIPPYIANEHYAICQELTVDGKTVMDPIATKDDLKYTEH